MAIEVLTALPKSLRAGDTIKWRESLADFPASDGWALSFAFTLDGKTARATGAADDDNFIVTLPGSETKNMGAGEWGFVGFVEKDGERTTPLSGTVQGLANIALGEKTHARKVLENIRALLEGKTLPNRDIESSNINGQEITRIKNTDLLDFLKLYEVKVATEEARARGGKGGVSRPYFC
jgi:hypothetical protein